MLDGCFDLPEALASGLSPNTADAAAPKTLERCEFMNVDFRRMRRIGDSFGRIGNLSVARTQRYRLGEAG